MLVVQHSSPEGEQGMPSHEDIGPKTNSGHNTAMRAERAVIARAKGLIVLYTLFDESLRVTTLQLVATITITLVQMVYQVVTRGGMVSYT